MKKLLLFILTLKILALPYNTLQLKKIKTLNCNNNFSFVVIGDNRDGNNILKKIISQVNATQTKFIINNGDLVPDGYNKEFQKYLSILNYSKKPIISVIGNHEIPWYDGKTNYERIFGKNFFSFIFSNSYFIILDDSNKKEIGEKEYNWLKKQLKKSQTYKYRFVFMHVPLYDPRKGKYKKGHSLKNLENAKKLNNLFDKYKVTMLFCSHIHSYFKGIWHKIPYIITGGGGAPLNKNSFYHYIEVSVTKDKVEYHVIQIKAKKPSFLQRIIQPIIDILNLN